MSKVTPHPDSTPSEQPTTGDDTARLLAAINTLRRQLLGRVAESEDRLARRVDDLRESLAGHAADTNAALEDLRALAGAEPAGPDLLESLLAGRSLPTHGPDSRSGEEPAGVAGGGDGGSARNHAAAPGLKPTGGDAAVPARHDRICIVTRPDLQPTVHGGAVKIVRTAEALSRAGAAVYIVTNDRNMYFVAKDGRLERHKYPPAVLSFAGLPDAVTNFLLQFRLPGYATALDELLGWLGFPQDEKFTYQSLLDVDMWVRVLYVGAAHGVDVYQAEFPGYAVPAALAARLLGGRAVLVEHNVEYQRLRDTCPVEEDAVGRIRGVELTCARLVDRVVAVSAVDRDILAADGVAADRLSVIPLGVDTRSYQNLDPTRVRAKYGLPAGCPLLVFHGTLSYPPNSAAIRCIVQDLLPRLHARGVAAKVLICGIYPPRELASADVIFPGAVDDLPDHLAAADLAVVPLDAGGGTRLKILEYFAAGLPVVSTTKGAEGIPAKPGVEIEIADGVEPLVTAVAALLADRDRAGRLGKAGRAFVEAYDWDHLARQYLDLYARTPPHPSAVPAATAAAVAAAVRAPAPIL